MHICIVFAWLMITYNFDHHIWYDCIWLHCIWYYKISMEMGCIFLPCMLMSEHKHFAIPMLKSEAKKAMTLTVSSFCRFLAQIANELRTKFIGGGGNLQRILDSLHKFVNGHLQSTPRTIKTSKKDIQTHSICFSAALRIRNGNFFWNSRLGFVIE